MTCAIIGFESYIVDALKRDSRGRNIIDYDTLPKAYSDKGVFYLEHPHMDGFMLAPERILFYSYFPDSLGFRKAMAFGTQPTWPPVRSTILHDDKDLSILVSLGRGASLDKGYLPRGTVSQTFKSSRVFKTGNDHCGEGKVLQHAPQVQEGPTFKAEGYCYIAKEPTLVEPFIRGESYRVLVLGSESWVIRYDSEDWRKNVRGTRTVIEHPDSYQMSMVRHANEVVARCGLPLAGIDYVLDEYGCFHFLETNCYPEIPDFAEDSFIQLASLFIRGA